MLGVTKADAQRTHHVRGCAGWEDCTCFSRLHPHSRVYAVQTVLEKALALLKDVECSCSPADTAIGFLLEHDPANAGCLRNRAEAILQEAKYE